MAISIPFLLSISFTLLVGAFLFYYIRSRTQKVESKVDSLLDFMKLEAEKTATAINNQVHQHAQIYGAPKSMYVGSGGGGDITEDDNEQRFHIENGSFEQAADKIVVSDDDETDGEDYSSSDEGETDDDGSVSSLENDVDEDEYVDGGETPTINMIANQLRENDEPISARNLSESIPEISQVQPGTISLVDTIQNADDVDDLEVDDDVISHHTTDNDEETQTITHEEYDFKKMRVDELRSIVLEKGLHDDPKTLKKREIVSLIQESTGALHADTE